MPPFFGLLANHIGVSLLPGYLLVILALMTASHEGAAAAHRRQAGRVRRLLIQSETRRPR